MTANELLDLLDQYGELDVFGDDCHTAETLAAWGTVCIVDTRPRNRPDGQLAWSYTVRRN